MKTRVGLIIGAGAVGVALVALATVFVIRSDSSSALEAGPSADEVAAVLEADVTPEANAETFEDSLHGLRVSYPRSTWRVTSGDSPEPHRIQLQSVGSQETEVIAEITIQPYLSEPVSDARCEDPLESKIDGHDALICTYSYGNTYKHFEPMPTEWSVISVTLLAGHGPIYISAAIERPFGEADTYPLLDELRARADEVMQIINGIELTGIAAP